MINSGVDISTGCNPLSSSRNFKGLWISPTFAVHGEVLWTGASNAPNLVSPSHHLPLLQRWCVDAGVFHKINIITFGLYLTYSHVYLWYHMVDVHMLRCTYSIVFNKTYFLYFLRHFWCFYYNMKWKMKHMLFCLTVWFYEFQFRYDGICKLWIKRMHMYAC